MISNHIDVNNIDLNMTLGHSDGYNTSSSHGSPFLAWDGDDFFRITAPPTGLIDLYLTELTDDLDLSIYNFSGNLLASSTTSGSNDENLVYNLNPWETYYVGIQSYNNAVSGYRFKMYFPDSYDYITVNESYDSDNNFDSANIINGDFSYFNSVNHLVDTNDYFKFTALSSGIATFNISELSDNIELKLYDSEKSVIDYSYSAGNITYNVIDGETYYIGIHAGVMQQSRYNLTVTLPDINNTVDNIATIIPYESYSIESSVGYGNNTDDFFQFIAPMDGTVELSLSNLTADLDLYLYDSSMGQLKSSYSAGTHSEYISYAVSAGQTYYVQVNPYNNSSSNYTLELSPDNLNVNLRSAQEIFTQEGEGYEEVGLIRVMADFSKAAYQIEHDDWQDENSVINNPSDDNAQKALEEITKTQEWSPLKLELTGLPDTVIVAGQEIKNGMSPNGGWFIHGNAAAYVARSKDAVVISFRGTNDQGGEDDTIKIDPDVDQWGRPFDGSGQDMLDHYALFEELIDAFDDYVEDHKYEINHVYVTGHSLGGAMAINYMANHSNTADYLYESITFAAPAFTDNGHGGRTEYHTDDRITQVEVAQDPVPMTWDISFDKDRPGDVLRFAGNNTMETPDSFTVYKGNNENHSMNYYREIVDTIDVDDFQNLLNIDRWGNEKNILIGSEKSELSGNGFSVIDSNDELNSNITDEFENTYSILYGGEGSDTLISNEDTNILYGGEGSDKFVFNTPNKNIEEHDYIYDFESGIDKIQISSSRFTGRVDESFNFSIDTRPDNETYSATLLFDTSSKMLFLYNNIADPIPGLTTGISTVSIIGVIEGVDTFLTANDIEFIA